MINGAELFLPYVVGLLAVVFSLLITLLAWVGIRIHQRLDSIASSLASIERDLRDELVTLDRRVSRIEGKF